MGSKGSRSRRNECEKVRGRDAWEINLWELRREKVDEVEVTEERGGK